MINGKSFIRGCGRGYCYITLPRDAMKVTAHLSIFLNASKSLPCQIAQIPGTNRWIVSYPLIKKMTRLLVSYDLLNTDSLPLGPNKEVFRKSKTYFLPTLFTNYLAKLHSFLNQPAAVSLRASEKTFGVSTIHLETKSIIEEDGRVYYSGLIHLLLSKKDFDINRPKVVLQLLDECGEIICRETISSDSFQRECGVYSTPFAIDAPFRKASITICCMHDSIDSETLTQSCSFESFTPRTLNMHIKKWNKRTNAASDDPEYEECFFNTIKINPVKKRLQEEHRFASEPKFSLIVPLFNTPPVFFREMLSSVLAQSYANWELILANASPETVLLQNEDTSKDYFIPNDSRIKVYNLNDNLGIALNTKKAIEYAKGDFVAFLDHDDFIEPDMLYEYARGINSYPDTDLLYCDEDKYENGHYFAPFLKPDWSPDLLLSCNYVTHMLCIRRSLLKELEPLAKEYEGAQDYFLTWRAAEQARNIYHARKVLYHWRLHKNSTAKDSGAKPYTNESGRRVVESHLKSLGIDAYPVDSGYANMFNVEYQFDTEPLVSIIIPNRDHVDELKACINSIEEITTYSNYEIIIVENNSTSPEIAEFYNSLNSKSKIRVIQKDLDAGFNYSALINAGAKYSNGEYLLLLNNDIEVIDSKWINQLLGFAQRTDVGAVGGKLLFPNGLVQHAGINVHHTYPKSLYYLVSKNSNRYFNLLNFNQNVLAVTGACLMVRKKYFDEIGGMDEDFPVDYNDIDFCLRLYERGYYNVYAAQALLYHRESVSRTHGFNPSNCNQFQNARMLFRKKWQKYFVYGDPFMNPQEAKGCAYHQLKKD